MVTALWIAAGFAIFALVAGLTHWLKQRLGGTPHEERPRIRPLDEADISIRNPHP